MAQLEEDKTKQPDQDFLQNWTKSDDRRGATILQKSQQAYGEYTQIRPAAVSSVML